MWTRGRGAASFLAVSWLVASTATAIEKDPTGALRGLEPPPPGVVRLFVVRHGEALSNLARPPSGSPDDLDRLTERGHAQSKAAGRVLAGRGIEAVVTSPARRARESAAEMVHLLAGPPLRVDDRLQPLHLGRGPDGRPLTWDEREAEWDKGRDPVPPEGESLAQLGERVSAAIKEASGPARGGRPRAILLVAHSEVVAAVLGLAQGRLPVQATMSGVHNASITVVDVAADGSLRVVAQDRVPWR
jgi:probable phosphoglycerate mutase